MGQITKSFANISDLITQAANKTIYIELSNGYFIRTTKTNVKEIAKSMNYVGDKFCGHIIFYGGRNSVQVKLAK